MEQLRDGEGGRKVPVFPPSFWQTTSHSNLCSPPPSIPVPPVLILLGISPPRVMGLLEDMSQEVGYGAPFPGSPRLPLRPV